MRRYFETSALVKLLIREVGSDQAIHLWDSAETATTSRLTYAEARAAVAAARRADRLTDGQREDAKRKLEERFAGLDVIEVTEDVIRSAGDLAERYALRAYDAVQLASALTLGAEETVFVSWDADLTRAASANGFEISGARS